MNVAREIIFSLYGDQTKLYLLIWKRAMARQMENERTIFYGRNTFTPTVHVVYVQYIRRLLFESLLYSQFSCAFRKTRKHQCCALSSLKRGAEELGIDLIDVRTENDESELIEYCGLPNTLATRGSLLRKVRELQKPPVYQVTARVINALNSNGARGNVYKLLEKYGALYSEALSKQG